MLFLLRNIRRKLLTNNRVVTYLFYAIGEIFLVVAGILIAVEIEEWNSARIERQVMREYYKNISQELDLHITMQKQGKEYNQALINQNVRSLKILKSKNTDSIAPLRQTLSALVFPIYKLPLPPIFEEFLKNGFLAKVKNDSLKECFRQFDMNNKLMEETQSLDYEQYLMVQPYILDNINISNLFEGEYIHGGPEIDFDQLQGDMILWNMLNERQTTGKSIIHVMENLLKATVELKTQLDKEITNTE